jgi:hypothetical protein
MTITINFPSAPAADQTYAFAGKTWKWNTVSWVLQSNPPVGREVLTADRTYYVRTDGSNSNTGSVNTAGGAFLTVQKAVDVVASLDQSIYNITIQVADGTYSGAIQLKAPLGNGALTLLGNTSTPANVSITNTISNTTGGNRWVLDSIKVSNAAGKGIIVTGGANQISHTNIVLGTCTGAHLAATENGYLLAVGNYAIAGNASVHMDFSRGGRITIQSRTLTLTGTPAFGGGFAYGTAGGGLLAGGCTFTGAATGPRYNLASNAIVDTQGGGASYFPGSSAGTAVTGSQYA